MRKFDDHEIDYVRWQNRSFRFYLGARLLYRKELYSPAAYLAAISCELLLKATLIYWDRSFDLLDGGHGMAKLIRMVKNKARNAQNISIPPYFYHEQRYLVVSRYPTNGKGLGIPSSFRDDLDNVFVDLILLVPFQHNTELKRALLGKDMSELVALRYKNQHIRRLRNGLRQAA